MAGVQSIVDQIINDAKKQADAIAETARKQIAENEQKTERQIAAETADIIKQAELDCREEERRAHAIADLESRKSALREKRRVIGEAFALAEKKILGLPGSEYEAFLFTLLKKSGAEGGTVWSSPKDSRFFTDAFIERAKKEISPRLSLGGVRDSVATGFVLVSGDAEINCTVDFVLKQAREDLEGDVARILFGGGD